MRKYIITFCFYCVLCENVLPAPDVVITEQNSTQFTIRWSVPDLPYPPSQISYLVIIHQLGANYATSNSCSQLTPIRSSYSIQKTVGLNYCTFTDALPFYNYNVTVQAVTLNGNGPPGYKELTTSIPEAPYNLSYSEKSEYLYNISWDPPCSLNGLINQYQINVSETYTEDLKTTKSTPFNILSNTTHKELIVKPSHIYDIQVCILLNDGIVGDVASINFTTKVGLPGIPTLEKKFATNTSFGLVWQPPVEKAGPIVSYKLNITGLRPLYAINQGCSPWDKESLIKYILKETYVYKKPSPYTLYKVTISARTSRGYSKSSSIEISTKEGVPENVRNVTYEIKHNPLNEEYEAMAVISFKKPCNTYGSNITYILNYTGSHYGNSHLDENTVAATNDSSFTFKLKPEYNYFFYITTKNILYENTYMHENTFRAPAGVPTFNSNISSIPVKSVNPGESQIILKKEYFSEKNGELKYIALFLSESIPTQNYSGVKWNSTKWPTSQIGSQLTEPFWNPFKENKTSVKFIIGGEFCNGTYCNVRLKDDTKYYLTIRQFNEDFFRDSVPIGFRTAKLSYLGITLKIIFSIFILTTLGLIGFWVWKKNLYGVISQHIYINGSSLEPLHINNKDVSPEKFIQYFTSTQDKPEILSEQYSQLAQKSKEIYMEKTTHFAKLVENERKNRYFNVLPYDGTRVKLIIDEDDEIGSDYINASYVKGYTGLTEYIATQGPLPSTCRDFWKMIIQENVTTIVMLAQFIETNKEKCYEYFPKNHENLIVGDDIEIRCLTELHFGTYLVKNLEIRKDSLQVMVTHMQFLEWPDFNVPTGTEDILNFIYEIRNRARNEGGVVVVHCSAGVGRTGTLIAADMLLQTVNAGKQVDIFNTVLELRKQRVMMVQSLVQYTYLHRLLAHHLDRPPTPEHIERSDSVNENMDLLQNQSLKENSSKRKDQAKQRETSDSVYELMDMVQIQSLQENSSKRKNQEKRTETNDSVYELMDMISLEENSSNRKEQEKQTETSDSVHDLMDMLENQDLEENNSKRTDQESGL